MHASDIAVALLTQQLQPSKAFSAEALCFSTHAIQQHTMQQLNINNVNAAAPSHNKQTPSLIYLGAQSLRCECLAAARKRAAGPEAPIDGASNDVLSAAAHTQLLRQQWLHVCWVRLRRTMQLLLYSLTVGSIVSTSIMHGSAVTGRRMLPAPCYGFEANPSGQTLRGQPFGVNP